MAEKGRPNMHEIKRAHNETFKESNTISYNSELNEKINLRELRKIVVKSCKMTLKLIF